MRLITQFTTLVLHILSAAGTGLRVSNPNRRLSDGNTASSLTLTEKKYDFGEAITVNFVNGSPSDRANAYPYIGIFADKNGNMTLDEVPSFDSFTAWLNDCGTQEDCDSTVSEGSVTLSAEDPREAYYYTYDYYGEEYYYGYGYFPFRDGKYLACFMNDIYAVDAEDGAEAVAQELIADCAKFQVRKPKKKMKKKAKVNAKRKLSSGAEFTAKVKTPVPVSNQWIGIYKAENGKAPKGDLDGKDLLWGYSACETQQGDQTETTNCYRKSKNSQVSLGADHLSGSPDAVWPLPKGEYFMCVHFHVNVPYNFFKCSKKIKVK